MIQNRTKLVSAVAGASLATAVLAVASPRGRAAVRRGLRATARRARYLSGRLEGLRYRAAGRHPDPSAAGPVLADRVRSVLGPLEHRLDVPRVHVMAEGHRVLLHGDLGSDEQVRELVAAVRGVPGVEQVDSHLQVGFTRGETRPSQGYDHRPPSPAMATILAAAHGGGAAEGTERDAARAVLTAFLALLPAGERRHVLSHLSADLRSLATPPRQPRPRRRRPRHRAEFMASALPHMAADQRETLVESVIGALRGLVPEETVDVSAVLPGEMRQLWKVAVPL